MSTISLIKDGWLKTPAIIKAFENINRADFLPDDSKEMADYDSALPIGFGQTISQPLVVAFMLEELKPQRGDKILDVGSGSGWTTALLAEIVGEHGKVFGIEIVPELKQFGEENLAKYNFIKRGIVEIIEADGSKGYEKEAPYDKILASASSVKLPPAWRDQLKIGGRLVAPIGNSIWVFVRKNEKDFEVTEYAGFVFVPLIEK